MARRATGREVRLTAKPPAKAPRTIPAAAALIAPVPRTPRRPPTQARPGEVVATPRTAPKAPPPAQAAPAQAAPARPAQAPPPAPPRPVRPAQAAPARPAARPGPPAPPGEAPIIA